jgi:D-alanyl-D-alanine carboxypeptidase
MYVEPYLSIGRVLERKVDGGLPGAFLFTEEADGNTEFVTAGVADLRSGQKMSPDSHYRVSSTTKTFTAVVALQLVAEGRFVLSDLVADRLPFLSIPNGESLTIEHLLRMRSGLFDLADAEPLLGLDANLVPHTLEESISLGLKGPPSFKPGERSEYCNTNYCLLERIIESVTGRTLGQEFAARILKPLGLLDTVYPAEDDLSIPEPFIRGYDYTGQSWRECSGVFSGRGDGGLISTAVDLAKFFRALLTGRLLPGYLLRQMQTVVPDDPSPEIAYGLGLIADSLPRRVVWGHFGRGFGYVHHPFIDPVTGRFAVWMLNGTHGSQNDERLTDWLFRFSRETRVLAYL